MIRDHQLKISTRREGEFLLESIIQGVPNLITSSRVLERNSHYAIFTDFNDPERRELVTIEHDLEYSKKVAYNFVKARAKIIHEENQCTHPILDETEYAPK